MPLQPPLTVAVLLTTMLVAACGRAPVQDIDWPDELPSLRHYQEAYARDRDNQETQPQSDYLKWVLRFYRGWDLYPDGWQSTSRDILFGVDAPAQKKRLEAKLAELGRLISTEWAKNSPNRAIRSRELSIWGQALLKSVNKDEEEHLVDQITDDVKALLSERIDPVDINLKRYYPGFAGVDAYNFD